jgi:PIN domain nuclease of toxin-antitoxin system
VRLLLDTHTFLWFIGGSSRLNDAARRLIEASLGRLKLALPFTELVRGEVLGNAMELLSIRPAHLDELAKLPFHHRDPFDQLIVAQGLTEDMTIVSRDRAFESYPVKLLWQDDVKPL